MRDRNLKMFEQLYDMVLELNCNDPNDSLAIAGSVVSKYNWNRIRYAAANKWHLYDLDRWELAARYCEDDELLHRFKEELSEYGLTFSENTLRQIVAEGDLFLEQIVNPLYEQDVEIVELLG